MTPTPTLTRRVGAELVGTAFLVMAVVGSGIAATRTFTR
jgi:glycerol uptake facilitator-like aquaporin